LIEPEIKELVEKAIRGDDAAFSELCRRKSKDILYYVGKLISNKDDAEDAAQEAILSMYQGIRRLQHPEAFYAWMYRVITNRCFNFLGAQGAGRMKEIDITLFDDRLTEEKAEFLPEEYLQREDVRSRLIAIINRLPRKRRSAVLMYYYEDLSYAEIAYALNVSVSTVSTNLMRARNDIRKELEKEMEARTENTLDFKKKAGTSAPLIVRALSDDATESLPAATVDQFQKRWGEALLLKQQAASAAASGVSAGSVKIIACALAGIAVIAAGVFVATGGVRPEGWVSAVSAEDLSGGALLFLDGDCDCGHVNPKDIRTEGVRLTSGNERWRIEAIAEEGIAPREEETDAGSAVPEGTPVYSGDGAELAQMLAFLYDTRADGAYIVYYDRTDDRGNKVEIDREFRIDTRDFPVGYYQ
jgi:RNA polymerase sigma-70 factor (ECF subfamily)